MPKAKKAPAKKRGRKPKAEKSALTKWTTNADTFEIETDPPPIITGHIERSLKLRGRLERTLKLLKPGQAFIVYNYSKSAVRKQLTQHFSQHRFTCLSVPDKDKTVRVYLKKPIQQ